MSNIEVDEEFKHTPLSDNSRSIRVVQVERGLCCSQLRCTLKQINLDNSTKYVCLSYMWGDPIAKHSILINERPFSIRQSLMEFLQRARRTRIRNSLLWIDAICVNQEDKEERTAQVRIMSEIYRSAESVLVYPGPCPNPMTFKLVLRVYQSYKRFKESHRPLYDRLARYNWRISHWRQDKFYRKFVEAPMEEFMTLPYWNRMWIVQEILLARKAQVLCHNKLIEWSQFDNLHQPEYANIGWWRLRDCTTDFEQPVRAAHHRGDDIYSLIRSHGERQCQVVNDRLYALLGLCGIPPNLPVAYDREPALVVLDIFQHFPFEQDRLSPTYPRLRDFTAQTSWVPRAFGVHPYLLCYSCFMRGKADADHISLAQENVQCIPRFCSCPEYPLRFVFSLEVPVRDGYEARFGHRNIRTLQEQGGSGRCEGCDLLLQGCRQVARMKMDRPSDTALLFEIEHSVG